MAVQIVDHLHTGCTPKRKLKALTAVPTLLAGLPSRKFTTLACSSRLIADQTTTQVESQRLQLLRETFSFFCEKRGVERRNEHGKEHLMNETTIAR